MESAQTDPIPEKGRSCLPVKGESDYPLRGSANFPAPYEMNFAKTVFAPEGEMKHLLLSPVFKIQKLKGNGQPIAIPHCPVNPANDLSIAQSNSANVGVIIVE